MAKNNSAMQAYYFLNSQLTIKECLYRLQSTLHIFSFSTLHFPKGKKKLNQNEIYTEQLLICKIIYRNWKKKIVFEIFSYVKQVGMSCRNRCYSEIEFIV